MYLIDLTSTENGISALKDSREVVGESTLDPQPLAFSAYFIFSEQVRHRFSCGPHQISMSNLPIVGATGLTSFATRRKYSG